MILQLRLPRLLPLPGLVIAGEEGVDTTSFERGMVQTLKISKKYLNPRFRSYCSSNCPHRLFGTTGLLRSTSTPARKLKGVPCSSSKT